MIRPDIEPVYLPHNERYLGQPHLLAFDKVIPAAMRTNLEVARRTFVKPLSPLQIRRLIERASSRPPSTRL